MQIQLRVPGRRAFAAVAALAAVAFVGTAQGQPATSDYWAVNFSDSQFTFVERGSIERRPDGTVRSWSLAVFSQPVVEDGLSVSYVVIQTEDHCGQRKHRPLQMILYSRDGTVETPLKADIPFQAVDANTPGESMHLFACATQPPSFAKPMQGGTIRGLVDYAFRYWSSSAA